MTVANAEATRVLAGLQKLDSLCVLSTTAVIERRSWTVATSDFDTASEAVLNLARNGNWTWLGNASGPVEGKKQFKFVLERVVPS